MSRVLVQRLLGPHTPAPESPRVAAAWCALAQRMELLEYRVSADGREHTYLFEAPDAETVRGVFRRFCPPEDVIRVRPAPRR